MNANSRRSPGSIGTTSLGATPPADTDSGSVPNVTLTNTVFGSASLPDDAVIGSPLKKHRASLYDMDKETMQKPYPYGMGFGSAFSDGVVAAAEAAHTPLPAPAMKDAEEEEL